MIAPLNPGRPGRLQFEELFGLAVKVHVEQTESRIQQELRRRRRERAVPHKDSQSGCDSPRRPQVDREPDKRAGTASKAAGARKGLGSETSAIRDQHERRAS